MKKLFVAWRQPDSGEWIPVACLEQKQSGNFRFYYTQGAYRASNFFPFGGLERLEVVYESARLFPIFSNRLISKSRPEFKDYLRWLGLTERGEDPISMLALTGGIRGTDSIELFQPPEISDTGEYRVDFFTRSLSFLPPETISMIESLHKGTKLFLMRDSQNTYDPFALTLRTDKPIIFVGFCPKYYAKDLGKLLENADSKLDITVKCVNQDAPLNMRLLCSVTAKPSTDFFALGEEEDFKPFSKIPATVSKELAALSEFKF